MPAVALSRAVRSLPGAQAPSWSPKREETASFCSSRREQLGRMRNRHHPWLQPRGPAFSVQVGAPSPTLGDSPVGGLPLIPLCATFTTEGGHRTWGVPETWDLGRPGDSGRGVSQDRPGLGYQGLMWFPGYLGHYSYDVGNDS